MTPPKNETIVKISATVILTAFFTISAWIVSIQLDINKYFQSRIDQMVDKSTYGKDHGDLSSRIAKIGDSIDKRLDNNESIMHTRLNRMESRVDAKFDSTSKRLESIQETLNKLMRNHLPIAQK